MLSFVFSALVVLLDQFFKRWVVRSIDFQERVELIPGVIELTYWYNEGAAFGILSGQRWVLAGISFIACLILVFVILRYTEGFWGTLGLAAVLGGAAGNLADRVFNSGRVVDMFRFTFIDFFPYIFNIADIFITLGFITFSVHFIRSSVRQAREEREAFENARIDFDEDYDPDDDYDDREELYEDPYAAFDMPAPGEQGMADYDNDIHGVDMVSPDMDTNPDLSEIREYIEAAPERVEYNVPDAPAYSVAEPIATQIVSVFPNEQTAPPALPEPSPATWQSYYEPETAPPEKNSTLDALSALELELSTTDDYDVDALLKQYGFENDK